MHTMTCLTFSGLIVKKLKNERKNSKVLNNLFYKINKISGDKYILNNLNICKIVNKKSLPTHTYETLLPSHLIFFEILTVKKCNIYS